MGAVDNPFGIPFSQNLALADGTNQDHLTHPFAPASLTLRLSLVKGALIAVIAVVSQIKFLPLSQWT